MGLLSTRGTPGRGRSLPEEPDPDQRAVPQTIVHCDFSNVAYHSVIMDKVRTIDVIDRAILALLQANARTSNAEIARRVRLAPSAVLARIRKLESRDVIRGYEARVDPAALDAGLVAFVFVREEERVARPTTGDALARIPEALEVHEIAGQDGYLVKVRARDTGSLARLLHERFGVIRTIRGTRTTIALATIKETTALPLPTPRRKR